MHDTGRTSPRRRRYVTRGEVTEQGTTSRSLEVAAGASSRARCRVTHVHFNLGGKRGWTYMGRFTVHLGVDRSHKTTRCLDLEALPLPFTISTISEKQKQKI